MLNFTGTGQYKIMKYNYVPSFLELSDQIMFLSPDTDVNNYGSPTWVIRSFNSVSYLIRALGSPPSPSFTQKPCQF